MKELSALLDQWLTLILLPIAVWVLLSGLDDLFINFVWLLSFYSRKRDDPSLEQLREEPQKRIAVYVPLWHEADVISDMVAHNVSAIQYRDYTIFIGVYPNDFDTVNAVRKLETRFKNVQMSMCPHDGPTSKADCLNWIYQRMLLHEEAEGVRFDIILPHDAEDIIHPLSFLWINHYSEKYDMVQIPVLPLPTPFSEFTHGLYCDEFAENQTKDLAVREILGGFMPSCGVGTGFSRWALEQLADREMNRIFDPSCLTEDYENGFRLHAMKCRQMFAPLRMVDGEPVATREYFPRDFRSAVKQRTRWITGISLQGWQKHGWKGGIGQIYWHWRDRKGLIGNFVSGLANVLFIYGLFTAATSVMTGLPWGLMRAALRLPLQFLLPATLFCQVIQLGSRMYCTSRFYGWWFAFGAIPRAIFGNSINILATSFAMLQFLRGYIKKERISWLKTDHSYPTRAALTAHKTKLGEVLVMSNYCTREQMEQALSTKPKDMRLGEHMVKLGAITEDELYEALSLQQNIPMAELDAKHLSPVISRALPAHVIRDYHVLPFKVAAGSLFVAGPDLPNDDLHKALREFTRLEIRFELITQSNFDLLKAAISV